MSAEELHWATITPTMRQVLLTFSTTAIGEHFYLAGGTALALQLGYRQSIDLDFFSFDQDIPAIVSPLKDALEKFSPILADSSWGNLVFVAEGVRAGFYGYGFPLVKPLLQTDGLKLASIVDIGLMKLDALLSRASRKDFHDLYAICRNIPLRTMLDLAPEKYPYVRDFESQVVRHMVYFERAERETPVPLIEEVPWETVKEWFKSQALSISQGWLAND
jgi:hypothetical protein